MRRCEGLFVQPTSASSYLARKVILLSIFMHRAIQSSVRIQPFTLEELKLHSVKVTIGQRVACKRLRLILSDIALIPI